MIDVDDIRHLVVAGHAAPWEGSEGRRQQQLGVENACDLAGRFHMAGIEVVLADFLTTATAARYRQHLPDVRIVRLRLPLVEARRRARLRQPVSPSTSSMISTASTLQRSSRSTMSSTSPILTSMSRPRPCGGFGRRFRQADRRPTACGADQPDSATDTTRLKASAGPEVFGVSSGAEADVLEEGGRFGEAITCGLRDVRIAAEGHRFLLLHATTVASTAAAGACSSSTRVRTGQWRASHHGLPLRSARG